MSGINELLSMNYIAVVSATIASYALGFIWYSWGVLGKAWANSLGITKEAADNTDGLGGAFIASLISGAAKSIGVYWLIGATRATGIVEGAILGAVIALIFISTSLAYYNGFARLSSKLTLINSAHSLVELSVIGAIIGVFV